MHSVQTVIAESYSKPAGQNLQLTETTLDCSWYLPFKHELHAVTASTKPVPLPQELQVTDAIVF